MNNIFNEIDALKQEIDAFKPFSGHLLKQLKDYYKIGLTYTSNALEGNSLTETETKVLLEDGLTAGGKPLRDCLEALGHGEAYEFLYTLTGGNQITGSDIQKLHHLFYRHIDEETAGRYRTEKVIITGSQYTLPSPETVPALMENFIHEMNRIGDSVHPVKMAALAHKEFVFIHPFIDGNGRVARLLMNLILLKKGYGVTIIPPVLRGEYIRLLEKAHRDDAGFIDFIAGRVKETQKDYLRLLRE